MTPARDDDNDDDDDDDKIDHRARFFARWSAAARERRAVHARNRHVVSHFFASWRARACGDARVTRELAVAVRALRVEVIAHVFRAWRTRTIEHKAMRRALERFEKRARESALREALRAWAREARTCTRRRREDEREKEIKSTLTAQLALTKAVAERDAALDAARNAETLYSAIEFRDKRREVDAKRFVETSTREAARALNRQRALVGALRKLRAEAVRQLEVIDDANHLVASASRHDRRSKLAIAT